LSSNRKDNATRPIGC